jgi:hypothetical protein
MRGDALTGKQARLGSPSAAHSNGPRGPSEPLGSYAQTRQERAAPGPALLRQVDSKGEPLAEFEAEPQLFLRFPSLQGPVGMAFPSPDAFLRPGAD